MWYFIIIPLVLVQIQHYTAEARRASNCFILSVLNIPRLSKLFQSETVTLCTVQQTARSELTDNSQLHEGQVYNCSSPDPLVQKGWQKRGDISHRWEKPSLQHCTSGNEVKHVTALYNIVFLKKPSSYSNVVAHRFKITTYFFWS